MIVKNKACADQGIFFAEWLRYSGEREGQLQPFLKNMIKAEKNLGASCNHNIISRLGHSIVDLLDSYLGTWKYSLLQA